MFEVIEVILTFDFVSRGYFHVPKSSLVALLLESSKQSTSVDSLRQDIINDAEYLLKSQTTFGTRRLRAYSYIPSTFSHLPTIFRFLFTWKFQQM